jgi:hypothetical protein
MPDSGHYPCPACDIPAPYIPSLTVMRPDNLWAGHQIEGRGYFTSKSRLDKTMKEKRHVPVGDRADAEGMRKMAREAAAARDEKFAQESREFMREQMAKRGLLDADGNLRPEASKPLSDTPLIHTNDDRVKR